MGWLLLTKAVCKIHKYKNIEIADIIEKISKVDLDLEGVVLLDKVWDSKNKNMIKMNAKTSNEIVELLINIM